MSTVPISAIDKQDHAKLACTYAALILQDEGLEINAQLIRKAIEASGNKVESFWPGLFARALNSVDVGELILSGGSGSGGAAATTTTTGPAQTTTAPAETKKDEKKKEEEKPAEEDVDMGGLFDF